MYRRFIIVLIVMVVTSSNLFSQRIAIATDVVNLLTLSPNVNAELVLGEQTSVNLDICCNPFNKISNNIKIKHIAISPEFRYWFKRPLYSHYIGANMLLSDYNLELKGDQYIGQLAAIGIGYGYSFILSKRWNIIPNIGVGYGYIHNYDLSSAGMPTNIKNQFKPLITRIGVSMSYIIN